MPFTPKSFKRQDRVLSAPPSHIYRRGVPHDGDLTPCKIKQACGACAFINTDYTVSLQKKYDRELDLLKATGLLDSARIIPPVSSPHPLHYRTLFKLAVRPSSYADQALRFSVGLFQPGSHRVVDMDDCPVQVEPLGNLLTDLRRELNASTLNPYEEGSGVGDVRYVVARSSHLAGEILLVYVVTNEAAKKELLRLTTRLKKLGHKLASVHMHINASSGNAIFAGSTMHLSGDLRLRERVCDFEFDVGPTAFFQVNPWQAENLYRRVEQHAGPALGDDVAWDLYCGVGQMSLLLARVGYRVLGIEENPDAIADAKVNASKNHLEKRTTFVAARVEDCAGVMPSWAQNPRVIVANPSRRGLHDGARAFLRHFFQHHSGTRFMYVSCAVETLARDLKEFCDAGMVVLQIEAFDMFAQTDKLEWLAVLGYPSRAT